MLVGKTKVFCTLLGLYYLGLSALAMTTPITASEARLFFEPDVGSPTLFLIHLGYRLIPSEFGIRLPFLILGGISALLYYKITYYFFKRQDDRYLSLAIYLFLPGVIASTVLASDAVIISALLLLFIYAFLRESWSIVVVSLPLLAFVHWSAWVLYMALIIYSYFTADKRLFIVSLLSGVVYILFGVPTPDTGARSYLLDVFGMSVAVLSPLLFLYIFYALYRVLLRGGRNIVWYISFVGLLASLLLSLFYRVKITDFSSYIMIGVITSVQVYYGSLRVRMIRFQKAYKRTFCIVVTALMITSMLIVLHKPLYRIAGKTYYPIVAPIYEPYDRACKLKAQGKNCANYISQRSLHQMRYYGIERCF